MWFFIIAAMMAASLASFLFLTTRFYKFSYAAKWAGGRKPLRLALAAALPALLYVGVWITMGNMNAMVVFIHFLVIWAACDGMNYLVEKKRKTKFRRYYAGACAIVITAAYMLAGWYLAHNVWGVRYHVDTEKAAGRIRIVQIADSHVGTTFDGAGFGRWMEEIQKEEPDIVVVTGDYVDDDTSREDMVESCRALGRIKTTYGVYFAFGNHDKGYYGDEYRGYSGSDLIAELEKNGVKVLQDESVLIDNRFYVIGRKDKSESGRGGSRLEMTEILNGLDADKYQIVLDHQPQDYEAQEKSGVDLVLSGHTHGGQFFPINNIGEWTGENDKVYGLEKRGGTNFIVTSGISDWAIKFKTGCKSEYVVVDVEGK